MDFIKYDIQKEDTLELISAKHNLSVVKLIEFHNNFASITQKIHSDYIPLHVQSLFIHSENSKSIIQNKSRPTFLDYKFMNNARYKIEISTSLYFMGKPISENKIESIWELNYKKADNSIFIDVKDKKQVKVDGQIKPLLEIINKINRASDVLHLQLNNDQTIQNVLNQDQVLKTWEEIKFEELKIHELEDDYFDLIIKGYDQEFKTLGNSLKQNVLYQIIFYPQKKITIPMNHFNSLVQNQKMASQLFPQQFVEYDLNYKSEFIDDKIKVSTSNHLPKNWNTDLLEKEFNENYKEIIHEPFQFDFKLESQYTYDEQNILQHIKTFIKEQANEKLFYIGEYNITLLEDDSNALKQ